MPTTLDKTRKHISKKRHGVINALHEKSRDSLRLRKANVRDQRLAKLTKARSKKEQPIVDRVAFFQEVLRENQNEPLKIEKIQTLIETFIHQYDEELDEVKKARRPGRPPSTREDLLRNKIKLLEAEHQQGFSLPDLMSEEGVRLLALWEGSWTYLTTIPWIKVDIKDGARKADFPAKGLN